VVDDNGVAAAQAKGGGIIDDNGSPAVAEADVTGKDRERRQRIQSC
jgi:hypothetical protein